MCVGQCVLRELLTKTDQKHVTLLLARRHRLSWESAEDLFMDTTSRLLALTNGCQYNPLKGPFLAYFLHVAAQQVQRRKKLLYPIGESIEVDGVSLPPDLFISTVMAKLPQEEQQLIASLLDHGSLAEYAREHHITTRQTAHLLDRARCLIQGML